MIAIGRGAIPSLIQEATTKHESVGGCIYNCLMALMDKRDLVTLQSCMASKTERLRHMAVVKMAALKKPECTESLIKALEEKKSEIRLEAALGLASLGNPSGIGEIIKKIAKDRKNIPPGLMKDLPLLKGKVYGSMFTPYLVKHEDPEVRISAAMVIVGICDMRLKPILGKALNDPHNLVKTSAVNALRKMVNGEKPRQFKNVFELVEAVNKWKKKLGAIR